MTAGVVEAQATIRSGWMRMRGCGLASASQPRRYRTHLAALLRA